jgi:uncharacterized protein (DUF1800 family)
MIHEIQRLGLEGWIDAQFALPPSQLEQIAKDRRAPLFDEKGQMQDRFFQMAVGAPDQLRVKTTWSLSQFIVVSAQRVSGVAALNWVNMLQQESLGNYRSILENVTLNPAMGWYLDNEFNKAKGPHCPSCEPNENYSRELMELFALGTGLLNSDGTWVRDVNGAKISTYSQRDVEQLAKALTGWKYHPDELYGDEWADWRKPMVPSFDNYHDTSEKVILGTTIAAGQGARKDLESVLNIMMAHGNNGPHVVKRLIQHFVKSNPSPAYVQRVVQVYRNNGKGVVGDMKSVLKAILLDEEARRGDDPRRSVAADGKYREPLLFQSHVYRALSCVRWPTDTQGRAYYSGTQQPYMAQTVFGFYSPHGVAAGSDLPAPEQSMVNTMEFRLRMDQPFWLGEDFMRSLRAAGCAIDELNAKYTRSSDEFLIHIGNLFFRGSIPSTLRMEIKAAIEVINQREWEPDRRAMQALLQVALISPQFGISK